jgi:FixJ family two-component response regulator
MFDMEPGKVSRALEAQPLNPTIFILEDDPDIAGLLKHHLQAAGYGVSWFPMSGGFLDEMYARRPALVILDIMVPGNNGYRQVDSEQLGFGGNSHRFRHRANG